MKRTIALMVLAPILITYLGVTFIVWNLDASQWSESTRAAAVFVAFFAEMIAFGVVGASGAFDRPHQ